jgi:hypothetical protein
VEFDRLANEMRAWFDEGNCQKELQPSLLGLDWSSFLTRKFTENPNDSRFWNPPEFIYYGFSTLDAYATAMLAAHFATDSLGELTFKCKLFEPDPGRGLQLRFETVPEHGRIDSDQIMLELLNSLRSVIQSKGIEVGVVLFLEGDGCPMSCEYPGRIKSSVSRFLKDRSLDLWPETTLTLVPTNELRMRARQVMDFLHDSNSASGELN